MDPNTVRGGKIRGKTKGELYLTADYKNQKQTNGGERQSSNQGRDKVAKQNTKFKSNMQKNPKLTKQGTGTGTGT